MVTIIHSNYSIHLLLTSCACFHMRDGREHIRGSRIPRPAFQKCSGKLGAAILLVFRAVKAILRAFGKSTLWILTLSKNTGIAHKGIYVHSQNIVLMFLFGSLKLAAIFLRAAPVSLRRTHPCFIWQLWHICGLLKSSLAPETAGFGHVLVFSAPSRLLG